MSHFFCSGSDQDASCNACSLAAQRASLEASYIDLDFRRILVSVADRVLHNPEDASDAVQDVFTRLYARQKPLNINTCWQPYLIRAARNRAIDVARRRRGHSTLPDDLPDYASDPATDSILKVMVDAAVARLPLGQRLVVELFLCGCSDAQIAALLHLKRDTVKARRQTAFKRLSGEFA